MQAFLKGGAGKRNTADESASSSKPSTSGSKKASKTIPWVEKYRPRSVDDIAEQTEIVATLKKCLEGADLPHFLFYGPPGTGKTSTIIAAARQLFGDLYKDRILELNASDERGIQVIRDKVKGFSQMTASAVRPDGQPCPPYKIIILDEADSMTHAAQAALRRTMEKETKSTRFCLICNYVSCIIPPLASRCAKYRFKPLSRSIMIDRLTGICRLESVSCDSKSLEALVDTSNGDLRRAITCLQSCARLHGGESIKLVDVQDVTGTVPEDLIYQLFETCKAKNYENTERFVENLLRNAYCAPQVLDQFHDVIIHASELDDLQKAKICEKIAICSWRLQEGANEFIQLIDLCCCAMSVL